MTKTGTIVKALQAVLLVTVLTPATVLAGPASNRQPVAQTQDHPAARQAKHINRGLILTQAEAAPSPNAQRPVEIPAVSAPQVEIPALPPRPDETQAGSATTSNLSTAAAPETTTTAQSSSVVTLPALPRGATDAAAPATPAPTSAPVTMDAVTTPAPIAPVTPTPAIAPITPAAISAQSPAAVATTPATTVTARVDPPATSTAKASPTRTAQTSHRSHARHYDDNFNFGGFNVDTGNINRQFTKFFNRRDVKSILSQYGLD